MPTYVVVFLDAVSRLSALHTSFCAKVESDKSTRLGLMEAVKENGLEVTQEMSERDSLVDSSI